MDVGAVAESKVNVAAVVEPSSFLTVRVVEFIANSCSDCCMSMMAWASVGATLSAAYDSVSAVVSTAAKFSAAVGTMAVTLFFIVCVRSPAVAAFVKFVVVSVNVTFGILAPVCVTGDSTMPLAAVMLVGVARPEIWLSRFAVASPNADRVAEADSPPFVRLFASI